MLPLVRAVPATQSENQQVLSDVRYSVWVLSSPGMFLLLMAWVQTALVREDDHTCRLQGHATLPLLVFSVFSVVVITS